MPRGDNTHHKFTIAACLCAHCLCACSCAWHAHSAWHEYRRRSDVFASVYVSLCLCLCLGLFRSFCLCFCLRLCLYINLCLLLFLCLYVSLCLSLFCSISVLISASVSVCIPVCVFVSHVSVSSVSAYVFLLLSKCLRDCVCLALSQVKDSVSVLMSCVYVLLICPSVCVSVRAPFYVFWCLCPCLNFIHRLCPVVSLCPCVRLCVWFVSFTVSFLYISVCV